MYLRDGNDLSLDFSDLVLSLHVVPELGLSKAGVLSENSHSVELGVGVLLRGETSANHEVLSYLMLAQTSENLHQTAWTTRRRL